MKKLSTSETEKITNKLQQLELSLLSSYGLKNLNGGYVELDMWDYNDKWIYLECKSGVQGEDYRVEDLKMCRETLELY